MGRVVPNTSFEKQPSRSQGRPPHPKVIAFIGFVYLLLSFACSLAYLTTLVQSLTNDFWWRDFNTTGAHTFLADVFNAHLAQGLYGDAVALNLFGDSTAKRKDYSAAVTYIAMREPAARQWMLQPFPLDVAVKTLRANSLYENVYAIVPFCWVDMGRQFELAHTITRQQRCIKSQSANAAMYLETLLRNAVENDLNQSTFGIEINQTILTPVTTLPNGQTWVTSLFAHEWLTLQDEVGYMQRHGLEYYQIQYQNRFQYGIEDKITITNALGIDQHLKISSIPYLYRGLSGWSTAYIALGLWNDMVCGIYDGLGLVRHTAAFAETPDRNWDIEYSGSVNTPGIQLVRAQLGPLLNFDTQLIRPPPSLVALVEAFQARLLTTMKLNLQFGTLFDQITPKEGTLIDVLPPSWTVAGSTMAYYGGNPVCFSFTNPRSFPQQPFSFYDGCGTQHPFSILFEPSNVLFAATAVKLAAEEILRVCHLSTSYQEICTTVLAKACVATQILENVPYSPFLAQVKQDIDDLNIAFVQMATLNNTNVLLRQPLVQSDDGWSFFGWLTLFDWVDGTREVLSLEGDVGTATLMSDRIAYAQFTANPLELPRSACAYFWYLTLYVTIVCGLVTSIIVFYGFLTQFRIGGGNLFQFNRVVGSVWMGRPILFLRGFSAILMLSTSTATFAQLNGVAFFLDSKRTWFESLIVSGESLWISYVVTDVAVPVTGDITKPYSHLSSLLAFLITLCMDRITPYYAIASIKRSCTVSSFRRGIDCVSGVIEIGSFRRVCLLLGIQVGSAFAAYSLVRIYRLRKITHISQMIGSLEVRHCQALIPSASVAYLDTSIGKNAENWHLDAAACVMSGMLPLHRYLLDLKLWVLVKTETLRSHSFRHVAIKPSSLPQKKPPVFQRRHAWLAGASLIYMVNSIGSSYAFLILTESSMANDFWWANFNTSTQIYLSNWFNQNLQTTNLWQHADLASSSHGAISTTTNQTTSLVSIAPTYASSIQNEAHSLPNVIRSLRQMDGCSLPWIMTGYCYVDFTRRWEMANTAIKQQRCANDQANGAVYLESMLRNTRWSVISSCWGTELKSGVFSSINTTTYGANWVATTLATFSSIEDELSYWQSFNILVYTTQWQNYKSLGVVEMFSIENAFGWSYPLTLKYSNSSLQLAVQTSFKMRWPFAVDLSTVASNASLVRNSPSFRYTNQTPTMALMASGYIASPLGPGFTLVQHILGPFRAITMKRVACPTSLQVLFRNVNLFALALLSGSSEIQDDFWPIYTSFTLQPTMQHWDSVAQRGGNIMCELDPTSALEEDRPFVSFSSKGLCGTDLGETLYGDTVSLVKVMLVLDSLNVTATSQRERFGPTSSKQLLTSTLGFIQAHVARVQVQSLIDLAQRVKMTIRDSVNVSYIQYILDKSGYALSAINFFSPNENDFELFAWLFMFDWVQGIREVVSFQGDQGTLTSISTSTTFVEKAVNPMEVPLNVAYSMRCFLFYITCVMLGVACVVCVYILAERGQIEAANMLSFSRVVSLVWIGRPLILLRALSAVCLLATANLQLTRPHQGLVSYFESARQPWYTIVLAAGELNWIVFIVNDVFSIITHQYTHGYSAMSFIVVWLASAIWGSIAPPAATVTINRICVAPLVDAQVECHAGTVAIGSVAQFYDLIGLVLGSCAFCYLVERFRYKYMQFNRPSNTTSYFLYAAAKHQFQTAKWDYQGVLYLDKGSAVLTGVLSMRWRDVLVVFDIKTWRTYSISIGHTGLDNPDLPLHLQSAIPLVE
ncbi:Aste57867_2013 [Aphanomyces stellatus]|uniref:Aste57867_2013 protein n=1 Tax=Aphanomyces stellatus TaxID=120398 RepID=A0A485K6P2_9STRA|nr:hypothetical protein As57867_002011 [Aphanomyces stellatus]VFT79217.1 Aste57867_2013 [Aphanomyces stellatus]